MTVEPAASGKEKSAATPFCTVAGPARGDGAMDREVPEPAEDEQHPEQGDGGDAEALSVRGFTGRQTTGFLHPWLAPRWLSTARTGDRVTLSGDLYAV